MANKKLFFYVYTVYIVYTVFVLRSQTEYLLKINFYATTTILYNSDRPYVRFKMGLFLY